MRQEAFQPFLRFWSTYGEDTNPGDTNTVSTLLEILDTHNACNAAARPRGHVSTLLEILGVVQHADETSPS